MKIRNFCLAEFGGRLCYLRPGDEEEELDYWSAVRDGADKVVSVWVECESWT